MVTRDAFIENNRRRRGGDPSKDSFKLESLENFNPRCMVIVKATPEEVKELNAIAARRKEFKAKRAAGETVGQTQVERAAEIRFYKPEEFPDETELEDQTSDLKPEPSQYPMKKETKPKKAKAKDAPTGDQNVLG